MRILLAAAALASAAMPALAAAPPAPPDPLVQAYADTQLGRFSSARQAAADPRYQLVEVRVVRLWPERTDGLWLYQEQSIMPADADEATKAAARARPYFQRVGHVTRRPDGTLRRENYPLAEPARFAGLAAPPAPADLGPAGCHNIIESPGGGAFVARVEDCVNSHRNAVTMTSLSVAWRGTVVNWDRGWSADGRQVWGPAEGGYVFERIED